MPKENPPPRKTLANHLKVLIAKTGLSAPEVAKKAGVDRKTVNNHLNGRYDPRPDQVRAVAAVFGVNEWDLINPRWSPHKEQNNKLSELIELYEKANPEGRENILRVAEMAANYKNN